MFVSDQVYLSCIALTYLYKDKKSLDRDTNQTKPKYKLACRTLKAIDGFLFFVGTSQEHKKGNPLVFQVEETDWLEIYDSNFKGTSYFDVRDFDPITKKDLLLKIKDVENGFKMTAKVKDHMLDNLKDMVHTVRLSNRIFSEDTRYMACFAVDLSIKEELVAKEVTDVLKRLNLD